jgi:hypothetical protein
MCTGGDRLESLMEAVREALRARGTVGAVEAGCSGMGRRNPVQPRIGGAPKATEPESILELARQQWRDGLRGRVQAVATLLGGAEQVDLPTPQVDGDD